MRRVLMTCSRGIALLLACLCVFSSLCLGVVIAFDQTFLHPETLVHELANADFYHQFHTAVSDQIVYSMTYDPCLEDPELCQSEGQEEESEGQGGPPQKLKNLKRDDWLRLLDRLLPPEWLEDQTEQLMIQVDHRIDHPQGDRGLFLDLTSLKGRLAGEAGLQSVIEVIQAQPPCEESELVDQISFLDPAVEEVDLPDCRPPDEILEMSRPDIISLLSKVSSDIPDRVDLSPTFAPTEDSTSQDKAPDLFMLLSWVRRIGRYGPLLPLSLLGLIALFAVRSWKDLSIWWGFPFLLTGLIGAGATFGAPMFLDWGAQKLLSEVVPKGLSPVFVDFGLGVVRDLLGEMLKWIRFAGVALTLVGLALLGLSRSPWLGGAIRLRPGSPE